jgi:hypothetical protein
MLGNASTSDVSGHCARGRVTHPSVFSHRKTGGAVASACILALSLVAAPPHSNVARSEVRAVRLAALALPPAAPLRVLLVKITSNQAHRVLPVAPVVAVGSADVPGAGVKTSSAGVTAPFNVDPAIDNQVVNNTTPAALTVDPVINAIFGPILAVAAFVFIFGVLIPAGYVVGALYQLIDIIGGFLTPLAGATAPLAATADPNVTDVPSPTSYTLMSDSAPAAAAVDPADAAAASGTGKADVSAPAMSIDKRTRTEQGTSTEPTTENEKFSTDTAASTADVTETVAADEESMEPIAAKAREVSADASTSEPVKSGGRSATPRSVVRDSLGAGEHPGELSHQDNGDRLTTRTVAAGEGAAATAGSSSAESSSAASSSTDSSSSRGNSSGRAAGGS